MQRLLTLENKEIPKQSRGDRSGHAAERTERNSYAQLGNGSDWRDSEAEQGQSEKFSRTESVSCHCAIEFRDAYLLYAEPLKFSGSGRFWQ